MKPDAQRIAIATKLGYTDIHCWKGNPTILVSTHPKDYTGHPLPLYLTDLNAMHEAVAARCNNSEDGAAYGRWLVKIVLGYDFDVMPAKHQLLNHWELARLANATATQRAEAFLRTLNLWQDTD